MKRIALSVILLLGGCLPHNNGSGSSYDALSAAYGPDAQILAEQTANELSMRHAPAHTALGLHRTPGVFGDALERDLRSRGFALVAPGSGSSLDVSYRLDVLDGPGAPALGYAQISTADGQRFSFSRELGAPAPITEPPSTRPVPEEHPLESRPLPETTSTAETSAAVPMPAPAAGPAKTEASPVPAEEPKAAPVPEPAPAPTPVAAAPKSAPEPLPAEPITHGRDVYVPVKSKAKASVVARRNDVPVADFCRWNDVTPNTMLTAGTMVFLVEPPSSVKTAAAPAQSAASASPALQQPTPEQISRKPSLPKEPEPTPAPVPVAASVPAPAAPATSPAVYTALEPLPGSDPVALPASEQTWEITRGQMLRSQMEGWAAVAGYALVWNAQHDYEMRSSATFTGSFHDAIKHFYAALQANGLALRVTIYEGNKVMEVNEH